MFLRQTRQHRGGEPREPAGAAQQPDPQGRRPRGLSFGKGVQIDAHPGHTRVARPRAGREERGPPAEPGRQRVMGWAE